MLVVGAVILAVAGGVYFGRSPAPSTPTEEKGIESAAEVVVAHVSGAVRRPGLVSLIAPARTADAIEAAGGASPTADLSAINLAGPVRDGDQIVVPNIDDSGGGDTGLIDLNRAQADQLVELQGIGPVLAQRIVAYRDENGRFATVEDLLDVPGIGEAKLALLRPWVKTP